MIFKEDNMKLKLPIPHHFTIQEVLNIMDNLGLALKEEYKLRIDSDGSIVIYNE